MPQAQSKKVSAVSGVLWVLVNCDVGMLCTCDGHVVLHEVLWWSCDVTSGHVMVMWPHVMFKSSCDGHVTPYDVQELMWWSCDPMWCYKKSCDGYVSSYYAMWGHVSSCVCSCWSFNVTDSPAPSSLSTRAALLIFITCVTAVPQLYVIIMWVSPASKTGTGSTN